MYYETPVHAFLFAQENLKHREIKSKFLDLTRLFLIFIQRLTLAYTWFNEDDITENVFADGDRTFGCGFCRKQKWEELEEVYDSGRTTRYTTHTVPHIVSTFRTQRYSTIAEFWWISGRQICVIFEIKH